MLAKIQRVFIYIIFSANESKTEWISVITKDHVFVITTTLLAPDFDMIKYFNSYSAGIDFRRQILTSKVNPRTVIVNICRTAADPKHKYSNELGRAN